MDIQQENSFLRHYSFWPKDVDHERITQEAWMKGDYFDSKKTIKIYKNPQYGYIKVYQLEDGSIFGYPIQNNSVMNWCFDELSDESLVATAKILRQNPSLFNFLLGNFQMLKFCEEFWIEHFYANKIMLRGLSDFNYSTCWTFFTEEKVKIQICIIAPFSKIEFCNDETLRAKIAKVLLKKGYLTLQEAQLGLTVFDVMLENASLPVNVDMCLFEEYFLNASEKSFNS